MSKKESLPKKKLAGKKTSKKPSKRKHSRKSSFNYTGAAAGLFAVCVILLAVFFYIKPAVTKENKAEKPTDYRQNIIVEKPSAEKKAETVEIPDQKTTLEKPAAPAERAAHASTEKTEHNRSAQNGAVKPIEKAENTVRNPAPAAHPPIKDFPPLPAKGTLIFVFDDAGHNLGQLQLFLDLPFPCTIAVLPRLVHSAEAAKRIREAGKEVILHQPMQSININIDPGEGAVKPGMSAEEIRQTVIANIEEIAPIAGMNNHEGSLITSDEQAMREVLLLCREKDIYFLDSRTTAQSAAPKAAKTLNMRIWERAVFLDNEKTREYLQKQIAHGLEIAAVKGEAVMIGHVFTPELAIILKEMYPALMEAGYSFSTISKEKNDLQPKTED